MLRAASKTSVTGTTAIGMLQGISLATLVLASMQGEMRGWTAILWMTANVAVLTVPLLWYFTEGQPGLSRLRRVSIVFGLGFVIPVMLVTEYTIMQQREFTQTSGAPLRGTLILATVGLPLLTHVRRSPHGAGYPWQRIYPQVFQMAWRNAIALAMAMLLAGIVMLLLVLAARVFLGALWEILIAPPVLLGLGATLLGTAMGMVLARGARITAVRRFLLSRKHGLLPLTLVVLAIWALSIPMSEAGATGLMKAHPAAVVLAWVIALAIARANVLYQDGLMVQAPSPLRRKLGAAGWLMAIPALGVVALPVVRLILEQGWSADRVWAVFVWTLAAGYVLGYALSMTRPERGWMWSIAPTNIAMSAVLCAGMLLLATPLSDARSLAAQDQIQRLLDGKVAADTFDYAQLALDNDRYGRDALKYLSELDPRHPHAGHIVAGAKRALETTRTDKKAPTLDKLPREPWEIPSAGAPGESVLH
jgi:hypothetical protein